MNKILKSLTSLLFLLLLSSNLNGGSAEATASKLRRASSLILLPPKQQQQRRSLTSTTTTDQSQAPLFHDNVFEMKTLQEDELLLNLQDNAVIQLLLEQVLQKGPLNNLLQNFVLDQLPSLNMDYSFGEKSDLLYFGFQVLDIKLKEIELLEAVDVEASSPQVLELQQLKVNQLETDDITLQLELISDYSILKDLVDDIRNGIQTVKSAVLDFLEDAIQAVGDVADDLRDDFVDAIENAVDAVGDFIDDAGDWIDDVVDDAGDFIDDAGDWVCDKTFFCRRQRRSLNENNRLIDLRGSTTISLPILKAFTLSDMELELLINKLGFETLELGRLLTNVLGCFLSTLHENPQLLKAPRIDFENSFADQVSDFVTGIANASIEWLENAGSGTGALQGIVNAISTLTVFVLTTLREQAADLFEVIVDRLLDTAIPQLVNAIGDNLFDVDDSTCPALPDSEPGASVDFRDLFLSQTQSQAMGGHGDGRYGTLAPTIKDFVDTALEPATLNSFLRDSLLSNDDNTSSMVVKEAPLLSHQTSIPRIGLDTVDVSVSNLSMRNLDSIAEPTHLMQPSQEGDGNLLWNVLTMDATQNNQGEPMALSLDVGLVLDGMEALKMDNTLHLSVNVDRASMLLQLLLDIDESQFLQYPLNDIFHVDCWLSTLATPQLDSDGFLLNDVSPSVAITSLEVDALLDFDVTCVDCSSVGLTQLPDIWNTLLVNENENNSSSPLLHDRLLQLAIGLAQGDLVSTYVHRYIADAAQRCADPTYVTSAEYAPLGIPTFSYNDLETLVMTGALLLQVGAAVVSQTPAFQELPTTDPLSAQKALVNSDTPRLFDFETLGGLLGDFSQQALDLLKNFLNTQVDAPSGQGTELKIVELLRQLNLVQEDGSISYTLDSDLLTSQISIQSIQVLGMDSLSNFDLFQVMGPQTLQGELQWDELELQIVIQLTSESTTNDITFSLALNDIIVRPSILVGLNADVLEQLELGSLLMESTEQLFACLVGTLETAEITQLLVQVGDIGGLEVVGFLGDDVTAILEASTLAWRETYQADLLTSLPGLFNDVVRPLLNQAVQYFIENEAGDLSSCPQVSQESITGSSSFLDMRDLLLPATKSLLLGGSGSAPYGKLLPSIMDLVQERLLGNDPVEAISTRSSSSGIPKVMSLANDKIVVPLTKWQSNQAGTLRFNGTLLETTAHVNVGGIDSKLSLQIQNAEISNLDTLAPNVQLLQPFQDEPHVLDNAAQLGTTERPLEFSIQIVVTILDGSTNQITSHNDVIITLGLDAASMEVQTLLTLMESSVRSMPLQDVLNWNCWLATLPAPALTDQGLRESGVDPSLSLQHVAASVEQFLLNVTCVDCSSPVLPTLSEQLASSKSQKDVTKTANTFLEYVSEILEGDYVQVQLDRLLNDAPKQCPHHPEYQGNDKFVKSTYLPYDSVEANDSDTSFLLMVVIVGLSAAALVTFITLTVKWIVRRRHGVWLRQLPAADQAVVYQEQLQQDAMEQHVNATSSSMATSPVIPIYVRWTMPVVLILTIVLFALGHFRVAAEISLIGQVAGEPIQINSLESFSMVQTVQELWHAGGKALAVLIVLFSGLWPYSKQFTTLVLWFIPPSRVSTTTRGRILFWLDRLAKWSMIDIFVSITVIVAFRATIKSPDQYEWLPDDFYSVQLMVVPQLGLLANLTAQIVSQIASHYLVLYHRRIVSEATASTTDIGADIVADTGDLELHVVATADTMDSENDLVEIPMTLTSHSVSKEKEASSSQPQRLADHVFHRPHRSAHETIQVRSFVNQSVLWMTGVAVTSLILVGCVLSSVGFEILGVLGILVEFGSNQEQAQTNYSVVSIATAVMEQGRVVDGAFGHFLLSALVIVTVLIVPVLQTVLLLVQWYRPSTCPTKQRQSFAIEILQAWQYTEVYLLALFVASWQVGPISGFLNAQYCGNLQALFKELAFFGFLDEQDAGCFQLASDIQSGAILLLVGAVLLALLTSFVSKATHQYLMDTTKKISTTPCSIKDDVALDDKRLAKIRPVPVLFTDTFRWCLTCSTRSSGSTSTPVKELGSASDEDLLSSSSSSSGSSSMTAEDIDKMG